MALLDTPQAMYGSMSSMTSQYLIQNGYNRNNYYRDYEQDTIARLNIQQRLHASPEQQYDFHTRLFVKEERLGGGSEGLHHTAFKPYSPGQENLPHHANQQTKVTAPSHPHSTFLRFPFKTWKICEAIRKLVSHLCTRFMSCSCRTNNSLLELKNIGPIWASSYLWGNLLQSLQLTDDDEAYFDERVILQMMMSSLRTAAHFSGRRNRVILKLDSIANAEH